MVVLVMGEPVVVRGKCWWLGIGVVVVGVVTG